MPQQEVGRTDFAAAAKVDELHPQVALRAEHQLPGLMSRWQPRRPSLAGLGLDALPDGAEEAPDLGGVLGAGWLEPLQPRGQALVAQPSHTRFEVRDFTTFGRTDKGYYQYVYEGQVPASSDVE